MIRTLAIATLLFATALALSGTETADDAGLSFVEEAAAEPAFCKVITTVSGLVHDDPACPHGPTP